MLVYIHVPFCITRCAYCAFHSTPLGRGVNPSASPLVRDYTDTLLLELAHWGDRFGGEAVQSVFFGGGTPSLLPPRIVGIMLDQLAKYFTLAQKAEITLEANPETFRDKNNAVGYLAAGVNRLSIGIQSMDETMLRALGRGHRAKDSLHAAFVARKAGFSNIGVDMLWGLPGQGVRQWLQTLKDMLRMNPTHISTYGLTLEAGTSLELDCAEGRIVLPPERNQAIMFTEGAAFLEKHGYLHYEVSNFARMGFQCRHNLGYWKGADYLGVGPSASSTLRGRRWTNPAVQKDWNAKTRTGQLDADAELLTPTTRVLELLMLRLRTTRGLEVKAYQKFTGRDLLADHHKFIQALHENGLIHIRHGYLSLTRNGMLVSNAILSNFFEQLSSTSALPPVAPATD
ncbi:MAG: oxygen-independent coproporphyrinogen III oxidase [Candidatus Desulfovibrio kirbyi]|uniref:Heme chaperone HemW n=1 Tax=Candidatus Desulfovibrio kirbyi TaxID=2696086 RepID=A0A6L2R4F9_9BACT|nr:MAG: oxygen-independent coproporphyrinogen III oxidase [Candidatus Desulfovibrio kirbyi]